MRKEGGKGEIEKKIEEERDKGNQRPFSQRLGGRESRRRVLRFHSPVILEVDLDVCFVSLFLSPSAPPSGRKRQNSFAQKQPPLRQSIPRGIRFAPCTPALPNARANFIELVCKHRKHRRNCKW